MAIAIIAIATISTHRPRAIDFPAARWHAWAYDQTNQVSGNPGEGPGPGIALLYRKTGLPHPHRPGVHGKAALAGTLDSRRGDGHRALHARGSRGSDRELREHIVGGR